MPLAVQVTAVGEAQPIILFVRRQAINLVRNDDSFSYDASGRPIGAFWRGVNYRRSLENRWLSKWSERPQGERVRQRRWLAPGEAHSLLDQARVLAGAARSTLLTGAASLYRADGQLTADDLTAAIAALDRILAWDWAALEADRERFLAVYKPIGILPPDQYLALVLQATEGCSHNACTFCTFYRDRSFRIKGTDEFAAHIRAALDFFGPAISLRRTIFLGDANALVIPFPRLQALFDVIHEQLSISYKPSAVSHQPSAPDGRSTVHSPRSATSAWRTVHGPPSTVHVCTGIYSFMDAFHVHRKSVTEWRLLGERGLRRVYIGMESGDDALLRFLNKPGDAADIVSAVRHLKEAGIAVSCIILLGAGGEPFFASHVQYTLDAINAMPLAGGDLIYFSDFVDLPGSEYAQLAASAGIEPLTPARLREQEALLRAGFRWHDPAHPPQISRYDIREFLY